MAPKLTPDEVRRVARLAHLELTAADVELFADQLSSILAYAAAVQQVDTTGVAPTAHVLGLEDRGRDDVPGPSLAPAQWIANAPEADAAAGLFKVPKVL
jgi:aspartyl-tRNA(Asn)/glutamyl-tRNA(Gln) amidotransferase subunit C